MIRYDTEHFDPPAPVASVSVTNPLTKLRAEDVTMLVDSGADVTLLPSSIIETLDIVAEGELTLQGYDGAQNTAPIVQAIVRWGKFTFPGQYVVGNVSIGVLGRDILNHLRLELNGPTLVGTVTR